MEFDYLVVGAGSAGCAVAGGLARSGFRVGLIEAGGRGDGPWSRVPFCNALQVPKFPALNNWAYWTDPQYALNGRSGYQPRGKGLGGSSLINGMIYLRGRPEDYDRWAASGCEGWGWDDVSVAFDKIERVEGDPTRQGGGLHIAQPRSETNADELFLQAAQDVGLARLDDRTDGTRQGVFPFRFTQFYDSAKEGRRCSSAAAFLDPLPASKRPEVLTKLLVDKLIIEEGKVVGVEGRRGGRVIKMRARNEVVLSAGAFGSPAILQRSGFGSASFLCGLGITPLRDVPNIGANLQDHVQCGLRYKCDDQRFMGLSPDGVVELGRALWAWRKTGRGWGSSTYTQSGGYLSTQYAKGIPDLQCHFFSGIVHDHGHRLHASRGYSAHVYVLDPESRGTVQITNADPNAPLAIDPRYFSAGLDLVRTRAGLRQLQAILNAPALQNLAPQPIAEIAKLNDTDTDAFIATHADTAYHPVGTCAMGGPEAPVDPQLRLRGVKGVRVADASVMPRIVGANTNAASIMIGFRAAELMLLQR